MSPGETLNAPTGGGAHPTWYDDERFGSSHIGISWSVAVPYSGGIIAQVGENVKVQRPRRSLKTSEVWWSASTLAHKQGAHGLRLREE